MKKKEKEMEKIIFEKQDEAKSKPYFGLSFRITIFAIIILSLLTISLSFYYKTYSSNIKTPINYLGASKIDYKVHLKQNNFYDTDVLDSDMEYVASLIDYIDTNLQYVVKFNKKIDQKYTYSIEAITRVYGDNNKYDVLFEKKKTLLKEKKLQIKNKETAVISENIKIDYDTYNDLISSFKREYAINSESDVTIVMNIKGKCENDSVDNIDIVDTAKFKIPLTEQTINIKLDKDLPKPNIEEFEENKFSVKNIKDKKDLIIATIILILDIAIIVKFIFMLNKTFGHKSKYQKTLNNILKENDAIIANAEHNIDETQYLVIKISSFEELKDVHNNTGNPILFTEIHKNQKSLFVIIDDKTLYKYTLKAPDLDKK